MAEGWIKLNRQLTEHWIWKKYPFSYGQAWVDLLLLANHEDSKVPYKGDVILCEKGAVHRSISFLAERWKWDRKTVRRFLSLLESDGMVSVSATTHRTTITIENWELYQDIWTTKRTINGTTKSQQMEQQSPTYKNEKNDKNEKNNYLDIVEYLNQRTGKNFRATSDKTRTCIRARLNEGFTVDDFKKVIDTKCKEWLGNPKMELYLRPETLFGTKFEAYLNQGGGNHGGYEDEVGETERYSNFEIDCNA